jgi:hypothetical protein
MKYYKTVDLFGNETLCFCEPKKEKTNLFTDYDGFLEKFEPKKTTDDCYTPPELYKIILDYVAENYNLTDKQIIRPFFPDGDFESIEYTKDMVVIDNPPFSIISKICRFYIELGVPFFLFAPHLTLFGSNIDCTHIVVGGDVVYENGANVKTSFLSNMFGDAKVIGAASLYQKIKELKDKNKVRLPKYEYPENILTVSMVSWIVERGISLRIDKNHTHHCRQLASQKKFKKSLFGSGFLISKEAAAEKAAAEKAAAEKAAAEKDITIIWELSDSEKQIINNLGL